MDGARHLLGMMDPQEMGKVNYLSLFSSQLSAGVEYLGGRALVGCWLWLLLPAQGVCALLEHPGLLGNTQGPASPLPFPPHFQANYCSCRNLTEFRDL